MSDDFSPKPWPLLDSWSGPDLRICKVRYDQRENPRNGQQLDCVILESADWVNVVALTPEKEIVTVKQFRFGTGKMTLEIPGGLVDPGETHRAAAIRELREETGYTSDKWTYLGYVEPNPAIRNNYCHQWLAEDVQLTDELSLDVGEDLVVQTCSIKELRTAIENGEMRHSLVLLALSQVLDIWR